MISPAAVLRDGARSRKRAPPQDEDQGGADMVGRSQRLANPAFWQGLAGIVGFFAVWALARRIGWLVLPGPGEVAAGLPRLVSEPTYWLSWAGSAQRVFAGFAIAAILAVALGLAMGISVKLRLTTFPRPGAAAPHSAARLAAALHSVLADQRSDHDLPHVHGRLLPDHHQRARRHRSGGPALHRGGTVARLQPPRHLLAHIAPRRLAVCVHRLCHRDGITWRWSSPPRWHPPPMASAISRGMPT